MHSKGYFKYINAFILFVDFVIIFVATKSFEIVKSATLFDFSNSNISNFSLAWALSFFLFQSAFTNRIIGLSKIGQLHLYQFITCLTVYFLLHTFNHSIGNNQLQTIATLGLLFLVLSVLRFIEFILLKRYRTSGKNFLRVAFYKNNDAIEKLFHFMTSNPQYGFKVLGVFNSMVETSEIRNLGEIMDHPKTDTHDLQIDELYCAVNLSDVNEISVLQQFCSDRFIKLRIVPEFSGALSRKLDFEYFNNVLVIKCRQEPMENLGVRFAKRLFDLFFSIVALCILTPFVFPIIAIAIKLNSKGPVFFKQFRTGMNEKNFVCYKFRTMTFDNSNPELQATTSDSRITTVGKFLRKTSLDELPQFFNVLIGNMSVVGPRPHMIEHTESYRIQLEHFMFRHSVRPGITGWAQINGFRGNTSNLDKMKKRVEFDAWYIENYSLYTDLKIVFKTVILIFQGDKNAY